MALPARANGGPQVTFAHSHPWRADLVGECSLAMRIFSHGLLALALLACDSDPEPMDAAMSPDAGPEDAGTDDAGPMCAATGAGALPSGLTTLTDHDGTPTLTIDMLRPLTIAGTEITVGEEVVYEQARFEIDRPTRIHGFRVQWQGTAGLPPDALLEAGLYPDFGHNGFDMWSADPIWTGTRCVAELDADGWATYALDEPVAIDQPGLVYVGHRRPAVDPGNPDAPRPTFWLDSSTDDAEGSCDDFDACRGSINMPMIQRGQFYNGTSLQLPWDYMVELLVEPVSDLPTTTHFAEVPDLTLGNRVSFGDYDNDGWDDFTTTQNGNMGPRLYRNMGDGTFTDVSEAAGIPALGANGNGVWGDYDNDGCLDLFVFAESMTADDRLLHNECDGTFTDATAAAGIVDMQDYETCGDPSNIRSPSPAAAWVDIDADGYLDLYVTNFICWGSGATYVDTVFMNQGDGTFGEVTGSDGWGSEQAASRCVNPIDADGDGDMDVLVGRYRLQRNAYYEGTGTGVVERAEEAGLAGEEHRTYFGHTIGIAWGDLDNDGDFDSVQANLAHPRFFGFSDKTQILMQTAPGVFEDNAGDWADTVSDNGLRFQETHSVPALADFDADGNLDLVISCVYDGRPTDFYWGNGDGTFRLDVLNAGLTEENGWGVATSDWDHDGDLDLAMRSLFSNEMASTGHWLNVRVVGNVSANRAAIGATVAVTAGGITRLRYVNGGTGQGCQDSLYLHYGVGTATSVDSIEVTFPGGSSVTYSGPFDVDQRLWLMEDGSVHAGWAPPPA